VGQLTSPPQPIDLRKTALHLRAGKILIVVVDRFELAPVNRNARARQQAHLSAMRHKLDERLTNRGPVRNKLAGEPHDLNVAPALALKPAARLNPIEITIDVELEQRRRMARGLAGWLLGNSTRLQFDGIELLNKGVDDADDKSLKFQAGETPACIIADDFNTFDSRLACLRTPDTDATTLGKPAGISEAR
jgi:hypothetical protein